MSSDFAALSDAIMRVGADRKSCSKCSFWSKVDSLEAHVGACTVMIWDTSVPFWARSMTQITSNSDGAGCGAFNPKTQELDK